MTFIHRTHITIEFGAEVPFTVNFYRHNEYTGDACGAVTLAEAMFISDLWACTGEVDWNLFYKWLAAQD